MIAPSLTRWIFDCILVDVRAQKCAWNREISVARMCGSEEFGIVDDIGSFFLITATRVDIFMK